MFDPDISMLIGERKTMATKKVSKKAKAAKPSSKAAKVVKDDISDLIGPKKRGRPAKEESASNGKVNGKVKAKAKAKVKAKADGPGKGNTNGGPDGRRAPVYSDVKECTKDAKTVMRIFGQKYLCVWKIDRKFIFGSDMTASRFRSEGAKVEMVERLQAAE